MEQVLQSILAALLVILTSNVADKATQARTMAETVAKILGKTADELLALAYASTEYGAWLRGQVDLDAAIQENAIYLAAYRMAVLESLERQTGSNVGAMEYARQEFGKWLHMSMSNGNALTVDRSVQTSRKGHTAREVADSTLKAQIGDTIVGIGSGRGGNRLQTGMRYTCGPHTIQAGWYLVCLDRQMVVGNDTIHVSYSIDIPIGEDWQADVRYCFGQAKRFQCFVMSSILPIGHKDLDSWLGRMTIKPAVNWTSDMSDADIAKVLPTIGIGGYNGYVEFNAPKTIVPYWPNVDTRSAA